MKVTDGELLRRYARQRSEDAFEELVQRRINLVYSAATSTALALAGLLSRNAVGAAPAHLAAKVACLAMMGTGSTGGMASFLASKMGLALATIVFMAGITTVGIFWHGSAPVPIVAESDTTSPEGSIAVPTNVAAFPKPVSLLTNGPILRLQIVTADTGKPIPDVSVECIDWGRAGMLRRMQIHGDRSGICNVEYRRHTYRLDLTAQKPPFADARVLWQKLLGDAIPTNYVLRMERAVPIGGTVVDADDNPVAGATVIWTLNVPDRSYVQPPRSNEFYGTQYETTSDQQGNWQLARVAEAVIPYLFGGAKESNYLDSSEVFTFRDASAQQQLRQGGYVFKLGRAVTVSGIVVDESGAPVPDATVRMGSSPIPGAIESPISGARSGISQAGGSFSIGGCQPGKQWVSATAPGFAQLLGEADLQENADLVRLVLHRGKLLSLQFVDNQGNPIPQVMVDVGGWEEHHSGWISVPTPSFQTADQEGRVKWSNAPDADVRFSVFCYKWAGGNPSESKDNIRMTAADGSGAVVRDLKDGMTVRPNGEEQVIVLERALFAGGMSQDTNHSERQK